MSDEAVEAAIDACSTLTEAECRAFLENGCDANPALPAYSPATLNFGFSPAAASPAGSW